MTRDTGGGRPSDGDGRDGEDHGTDGARELEEELAQLRSGASLALVAASLVHDFNNLLTPVLILSSRLVAMLDEEGEAKMLATEIQAASTLAASLMRDVLSLARPRAAAAVESVDVNDVIVERRRLIERLVGDQVEVVLDLCWDLGEVRVDRRRLEYALLNLVANARDAMHDGGTLTISTRDDASEGGARRTVLAVADTGVGMSEDVRRRAFDGFFTTKSAAGGLGIGLATVQRFAREFGGQATLDSAPAKGTRAAIHLPAEAVSGAAVRPPAMPTVAGAGRRVLVADADERVRRAVKIALEARGFDVELAATAEAAIEVAAAAPIHVALVDTRLPCRDPRTFLHRVKVGSPDVRFVFLADAADDERTAELRASVLPKAFSEPDLLRAVDEAIGR